MAAELPLQGLKGMTVVGYLLITRPFSLADETAVLELAGPAPSPFAG